MSLSALEGVIAECTKKMLVHLEKVKDDHFEKVEKDGEEFVVSNCKECKSSEKPLFRLPTMTGSGPRVFKEVDQVYWALRTESVKHYHVPNEKEENEEDDYEERNRAAIFECYDECEDEDYGSEAGPFTYYKDGIWTL